MTDVDVEALQRLVRSLKDERDELSQWKAEALPILAGLQDLGHALDVPPGQRITGYVAAQRAKELRATIARVEALADEWETSTFGTPPSKSGTLHYLRRLRKALAQQVTGTNHPSKENPS